MAGPVSRSFWTSTASWYAGHREAQLKAARSYGGIAPVVGKEQQWRNRGEKYLRSRPDILDRVHKGGFMVRVDPALSEAVADLMAAAAPRLQAAFDRWLGGLAQQAFERWPEHTGLSKSLLGLEYTVERGGERFRGIVTSRAPYTLFIKSQPHRELIERPGRTAAEFIAREAIDELAREGG